MLIYAQAESSQTLWLICVVKLAVLSLEAWRARVTGWRRLVWFFSACGVAVIPSDAPDRFSILILSRSFYTIDELVVFCSANQAETFTDCWTTRAGSFSQSCLTSLWGGGKKNQNHIQNRLFSIFIIFNQQQLETNCTRPAQHQTDTLREYRGQLLVALRDRCFPHKVSETQTDEIWRNAGAHYKRTSFCLKIWRFMTDFKSLTALWPIMHFPMWLVELAECSGVSALYLLHIYHAPIKHIEAPC